jgi:stage II sporulation protein AB (anti-sigma F factor)
MDSHSVNESLARVCVSVFIAPLDPQLNEHNDIKTAVSEAVTNAIIHGYADKNGEITMSMLREGRRIVIEISDEGVGIADVAEAREPLFTTKPDMERSGMGFTVMESFMDTLEVRSEPGSGTTVIMTKTLVG